MTRDRRRPAPARLLAACAAAACVASAVPAAASAATDPPLGQSSRAVQRGFDLGGGDSARVDVTTGNLAVTETDVVVTGLTLDVRLDRTYNSRSAEVSDLGPGWRLGSGYDVRLIDPGAATTTYLRGDGRRIALTRRADGSYGSDSERTLALRPEAGGWRLSDAASPVELTFAASGLLASAHRGGASTTAGYTSAGGLTRTASLGDEFGGRASFSHDGFGRTIEVDDPDSGHRLFGYDGGAAGPLRSVGLPDGRRFAYDYASSGCRTGVPSCLTEIRRPDGSVLRAAYGTDGQVTTLSLAAGGATRTLRFEYLPSVTRVSEDGTTVEYVYRGERVVAPDGTAPVATLSEDDGDGGPTPEDAVLRAVRGADVELDVEGSDLGSGLQRLEVTDQAGTVLGGARATCEPLAAPDGGVPEICPETFAASVTLTAADLERAGAVVLVRAVDAAGNVSAVKRVGVVVDDTAPAAPTDLRVLDHSASQRRLTVIWEGSDDDAAGNEGSGLETSEVRFRRGTTGSFSAWRKAPMDLLEVERVDPDDTIEVQVRSIDQAGNVGPVTSAELGARSATARAARAAGGTATYRLQLRMHAGDGRVFPSAGTPVELEGEGVVRQAQTDAEGRVAFDDLRPGRYRVDPLADPDGTRPTDVTVRSADPATDRVTIKAGYDATAEEKRFCATNGTYCAAFVSDVGEAEDKAERLFTQPEGRSENTRTNAFKHAYWHAVMVNSIAQTIFLDDDKYYKAREFGEAHEARSLKSGELALKRASAMDVHNNRVGYEWAVKNSPGGDGNHSDEFFCWTIRTSAAAARQGTFRPNSTQLRGVPTSRLAYLRRFHQATGERVRVLRNAEFSNRQACIEPD